VKTDTNNLYSVGPGTGSRADSASYVLLSQYSHPKRNKLSVNDARKNYSLNENKKKQAKLGP
jgi:hypothetical protein